MNEDAQDKDSDQTMPPPETSSTGAPRAPFVTLERVREVIGESDLTSGVLRNCWTPSDRAASERIRNTLRLCATSGS